MDGAIHSPAARQCGVRRVHDGIHGNPRDIAFLEHQFPARAARPFHTIYYNRFVANVKNPLVISFAVAAGIVLAIIGAVFYAQRGSHLQLQGQILKVRTAPIDDNSSVAVVDFRFTNVADFNFNVLNVAVTMQDSSGMETQGMTVSEIDTERLFQGIPLLGQKYNQPLTARDTVAPHATEDRMIAARFEIPEDKLEKRKQLTLHITALGGLVSDIREK